MTEQNQSEDWKAKLPEGIRASKLVADAKTEENFWKRIEDQQRHLGGSIRIPSGEASPEQWAEFNEKLRTRVPGLLEIPKSDDDAEYSKVYQKLGKPDKADKYSVESIKDLKLDAETLSELRQTAYDSDLTQRQFVKLANKVNAERAGAFDKYKGEREADEKGLRAEWGVTFDDRIAQIDRFLADSGAPEGVREQLKNKEITSDQVRWLHKMSKRMNEGSELSDLNTNVNVNKDALRLDPIEANARLDEIYANKNHAYHRPGDPGYKDAVARVVQLVGWANP